MPVRTRVTAAEVADRRPAAPSTPSTDVPTHSASALNASAKPSPAREPTNSPRVPAAAIAIDRPLSNAAARSGVSRIAPAP